MWLISKPKGTPFFWYPLFQLSRDIYWKPLILSKALKCLVYLLLCGRFSLAAQYTRKGLRKVLQNTSFPYFLPHSSQVPALYETHHFRTHRPISHFCSPCSLILKHLSPTLEISHPLRTAQISPAWRTPPPQQLASPSSALRTPCWYLCSSICFLLPWPPLLPVSQGLVSPTTPYITLLRLPQVEADAQFMFVD